MTEWFRSTFGADYMALYAHRDESEARAAVELILRVTGLPAGSAVLDAPCGAGRHVRAFKAAGLRAVGIDLSAELLAVAGESGASVARADLRHLPFCGGSFPLVSNLFSSFGYMDTPAENAAIIAELARVCSRGGWLVIDFMNEPHVRATLDAESHRETANGATVHEERWITAAPARVNKRTRATQPGGEMKEFFESVRLFTRSEMEAMMAGAGVRVREIYGDYSGGEWSEASPRLILVGQKS